MSSMCEVGSEKSWWQGFLQWMHTHSWIISSWVTGSFPILCLNGPPVYVFLERRNQCVPGYFLNAVRWAEACQLWHCSNNYKSCLLSFPLTPVQCAALLSGVCYSLTHGKSQTNWEDLMYRYLPAICHQLRSGTPIIPLENKNSNTLCAHVHSEQGLATYFSFLAGWGTTLLRLVWWCRVSSGKTWEKHFFTFIYSFFTKCTEEINKANQIHCLPLGILPSRIR